MARLPFDPEKMAGPGRPAPSDDRLTVADLATIIGRALTERLPATVRVVGEVSGFSDRTHWYFSLKDELAVISCVMFASAARGSTVRPENGRKILATGRVDFFARQGRTQLYVDRLDALGAGELEARYQALCAELRELGWFAPERKRPLPPFPRRVAIVTSRTGAALQDVLDTMRRRCPAVEALVVDVRVQGDGAAEQIARALRRVSMEHESLGVDAVILTRGGGSLEDLWAFNERVVARAVLESIPPVVAAIGHETDTTIAELVSDERAATPPQAAMRLTPDAPALAEQVDQSARRMTMMLVRRLARERSRVEAAGRRPLFADPLSLVARARNVSERARADSLRALRHRLSAARLSLERHARRLGVRRPEAVYAARRSVLREERRRLERALAARMSAFDPDRARARLTGGVRASMDRHGERVDALERELIVVGPANVLARGYSVTTRNDGAVVRSTSDVRAGEIVETRLADGAFRSTVGGDARPSPARGAPDPLPPRRRRRRGRDDPDQMGLFGGASPVDTPDGAR